ncbi:DNA replication/checkpoint protein [Phaffia rhodozyma]|uniref:DNA replication regulator SLD2 n=1 Tax=Phaffia rhodozyma TaxID=264483 RepID=A0A0F7SMG1_PHARH|nr:DNA replication/checkpoint protein [Phaffia rhodozyma]
MSDLQVVKLELKQWERSFKASNGRDPRKEDIKQDPEIAEKYRVYNKSRKDGLPAGTGNASTITPSSVAPSGSVTLASSTTTLNIPATNMISSPSTPSKPKKLVSTGISSSSSLATMASKPTITSPPRSSGRFQPKNPFLLSPTRPSSSDASPDSSIRPHRTTSTSAPHSIVHDADSLLTETAIGWTPRTKARKRLNGEIGGDTPKGKKRRGIYSGDDMREDDRGDDRYGRNKVRRKAGRLDNVKENGNDEEDVVGPSPMKPQDQPRRALPARHRQPTASSAARGISDDDEEASTDADEDYTDETDSDEPAGASKGKGRIQGTPRSLFTRGKSVLSSATDASGATLSSSISTIAGSSSRTRPFTFTTTKAWDTRPPTGSTSQDPPTLSSILSPKSSTKKASQTKTSRGRSLSMTGEGKPPAKKVRAWSGKPKVGSAFGAAAEARAKKAEQTLREMAGEEIEEEAVEDDGGAGGKGGKLEEKVSSTTNGGEKEEQEGFRIVRSHLLGVPKRDLTVAPLSIPIPKDRLFRRNQPTNEAEAVTFKNGKDDSDGDEDDEGTVAEVQVSDEGMWNSDLETDLQPSKLYQSPKKHRSSNRRLLYGLPNDIPSSSSSSSSGTPGPSGSIPGSFNELDTGLDAYPSPYGIEPSSRSASSRATSRMINDDLPPHLLALLSLRSPEATSAKVARKRDETFKSIFAVPAHQAASTENGLDDDIAGAELTRGPGGFKNGRGKGRQSRPNRWNGGLKATGNSRESTDVVGTGAKFMGPPQPPTGSGSALEVGTWDRPKEKHKVKREVWGIGDTAEVQGIEDGSDDDWASEPEGWKETPGGMLEDEDW